ncbi:MAG: hypothetical protein AAF409_03465 [Pseudomonadota bacterium]
MNAPAQRAPGGNRDLGIFAVVAIAIIGVLWLISDRGEPDLDRSAIGTRGLIEWLKDQDIEARGFTGGGQMARNAVGLRILPLYDTDLRASSDEPETADQLLMQTTQRDLWHGVVEAKIRRQPTLVVLPKWRSGVYLADRAHKVLLVPAEHVARAARHVDRSAGRTAAQADGWATFQTKYGKIGLFHAQTIDAGACKPLIGSETAMILGRCPIGETRERDNDQFWLLSDPDLLNNHGLNWESNADVALAVIRELAGEEPVLLDYTRSVFSSDRDWEAERRERTWEEFTRMFAWPFTMIWIAFGFLGALVLWRAVTRYGPLARMYEDEPRASKEVSIEAKARLLRLADHDTALLADHIRERLHHLTAELLGPHRQLNEEPLGVLTRLIARRNGPLARELEEAADLPAGQLAQGEILRRLDRFETCYDKVTNEFGRA